MSAVPVQILGLVIWDDCAATASTRIGPDVGPVKDRVKAAFKVVVHRAIVDSGVNAGVGDGDDLSGAGIVAGPGLGRAHDVRRHVVVQAIYGAVLDPEHLGPGCHLVHAPLGQQESKLLAGRLAGRRVQLRQPRLNGLQIGALKEHDPVVRAGPVQVRAEPVGRLVHTHPAHHVEGRHLLAHGAVHPHQEGIVGQVVHYPPAQRADLFLPFPVNGSPELDDVGALAGPGVGIGAQGSVNLGLALQRIEGGVFQS